MDGSRNTDEAPVVKTARFYAVYGFGGFSVGVLKLLAEFCWETTSLFTHQFQA